MQFLLVPLFFTLLTLNILKLLFYGWSLFILFEVLVSFVLFVVHMNNFEKGNNTFFESVRDILLLFSIFLVFFCKSEDSFCAFVVEVLSYHNTPAPRFFFIYENMLGVIGLYTAPAKVYISISGLTAVVASYISKVIENRNNVEAERLFLKAANLPSGVISFKDIRSAYRIEPDVFRNVFLVIEENDSSTTKQNYLLFAAAKIISSTIDYREKILLKSNSFLYGFVSNETVLSINDTVLENPALNHVIFPYLGFLRNPIILEFFKKLVLSRMSENLLNTIKSSILSYGYQVVFQKPLAFLTLGKFPLVFSFFQCTYCVFERFLVKCFPESFSEGITLSALKEYSTKNLVKFINDFQDLGCGSASEILLVKVMVEKMFPNLLEDLTEISPENYKRLESFLVEKKIEK